MMVHGMTEINAGRLQSGRTYLELDRAAQLKKRGGGGRIITRGVCIFAKST